MNGTDRRTLLRAAAGTCALVATPYVLAASERQSQGTDRPPPLADDLVLEFVRAAHVDIEATRRLLEGEPRLIKATWDWGGGDFETAIGGAGHMGRRDIAAYLLDAGAPIDLFVAAMLGRLPLVRAALEGQPSLLDVPGPHGITLIAHARAGGEPAATVLEYLLELEAARARPNA